MAAAGWPTAAGTGTGGAEGIRRSLSTGCYVRLWSLISGNWYFRDYVYWAASGSSDAFPAEMALPGLGATLPGSVATFQWTTGIGVTQYILYVGTKRGIKTSSTPLRAPRLL